MSHDPVVLCGPTVVGRYCVITTGPRAEQARSWAWGYWTDVFPTDAESVWDRVRSKPYFTRDEAVAGHDWFCAELRAGTLTVNDEVLTP